MRRLLAVAATAATLALALAPGAGQADEPSYPEQVYTSVSPSSDDWLALVSQEGRWAIQVGEGCPWIASGLGRVFFGGKEPDFYWHNGFFWVKLALFALVSALELTPMVTFIRVRSARTRRAPLPRFRAETYRRINSAQLVLVVGHGSS